MFCLKCGFSSPIDKDKYYKEMAIWSVWQAANRAFREGYADDGLTYMLGVGGSSDISKTYFYDSFVGVVPAGLLKDTLFDLTSRHMKILREGSGYIKASDKVLVVPVQRVPGYTVGFIIMHPEYEAYLQIRDERGIICINMSTGRVLSRLDKSRDAFSRARAESAGPSSPALYIKWDPAVDRFVDLLPKSSTISPG